MLIVPRVSRLGRTSTHIYTPATHLTAESLPNQDSSKAESTRRTTSKMRLSHATLFAAVGLVSAAPKPAHQARLWATHYNGNVYTLTLDGESLSLSHTMKTCGNMPSWLTFDSEARVLYCSDEDGTADPSTHGTLTAYQAASNGKLYEIATTKTIGGGVNSVIYENDDGEKYLAIAH